MRPPDEEAPRPRSPHPAGDATTHATPALTKNQTRTSQISSEGRQQPADILATEAMAIAELGATVISSPGLGVYAVEAAIAGWRVLPLRGKVPAVRNPHPEGSDERRNCKGECGLQRHGVLDATADVDTVIGWWTGQHRGRNIGVRIPDSAFLLDVDPRQGGDKTLAELIAKHGPLPETLQQFSGRGDGGTHHLFRRPPGDLTDKRLGPGLDIKTSTGYMVWAPSIHPDTGQPYRRVNRDVAAPPDWLTALVVAPKSVPPASAKPPRSSQPPPSPTGTVEYFSGSIADAFCAATSWADILLPHGWSCRGGGPDDGAVWLHPTATSSCSATVKHGCLFVYSTNTPFEVTSAGDRHGVTKFRAHAVLNHGGDLSAAARALSQEGPI